MPARDNPSTAELPKISEVLDKSNEVLDSIETQLNEIIKILFGINGGLEICEEHKGLSHLERIATNCGRLQSINSKLALILQEL